MIKITILTATFKTVLGINPDVWLYIFIFLAGSTFFWLLISLNKDLKAKSIEDIKMDIIKDICGRCEVGIQDL